MMVYNIAGLTGTPELSNEAAGIFIWCLTQSAECFRQWVSSLILILHSPNTFP